MNAGPCALSPGVVSLTSRSSASAVLGGKYSNEIVGTGRSYRSRIRKEPPPVGGLRLRRKPAQVKVITAHSMVQVGLPARPSSRARYGLYLFGGAHPGRLAFAARTKIATLQPDSSVPSQDGNMQEFFWHIVTHLFDSQGL